MPQSFLLECRELLGNNAARNAAVSFEGLLAANYFTALRIFTSIEVGRAQRLDSARQKCAPLAHRLLPSSWRRCGAGRCRETQSFGLLIFEASTL
jgi:hypothetical protein